MHSFIAAICRMDTRSSCAADRSDFVHHLQRNVNPSALFNTKNLLFPQPLKKIAPLPSE